MKKHQIKIIISIAFVSALLILACDDYGLMPPSVLTGEVHFIGAMPSNVTLCYVVVAIDFPPLDTIVATCDTTVGGNQYHEGDTIYTYKLDISYLANYYQIMDSLWPDTTVAATETTDVPFRIELGPGTYNWTFVAAIGNEDSIDLRNVIGQYNIPGDTIAQPITIASNDSQWISVTADLNDATIP